MLASTLNSRRIRSTSTSRCSSPMPEMIVCPVSSSVLTWRVGSSSASRWMAMPSLSWSPLVLGSIATLMTGAGKVIDSRITGSVWVQRVSARVALALGPRLDRDVDDRRREGHRLQDHRLGLAAERVAGGGVLQPHHGHDLPGNRERALLALVRVHLVDLADPLLAPLGGFQQLGAGLQAAGVNPDVGQLAEMLVRHDLEGQRGKRLADVSMPLDDLFLVTDRMALDAGDVQRAGQVVHNRVQHRLHALVLERAAAQHRGNPASDGRAPDGGDELRLVRLGAVEVELHHLLVV